MRQRPCFSALALLLVAEFSRGGSRLFDGGGINVGAKLVAGNASDLFDFKHALSGNPPQSPKGDAGLVDVQAAREIYRAHIPVGQKLEERAHGR